MPSKDDGAIGGTDPHPSGTYSHHFHTGCRCFDNLRHAGGWRFRICRHGRKIDLRFLWHKAAPPLWGPASKSEHPAPPARAHPMPAGGKDGPAHLPESVKTPATATSPCAASDGRLGANRVQFRQNIRALLHRGELHPLDFIQNRPSRHSQSPRSIPAAPATIQSRRVRCWQRSRLWPGQTGLSTMQTGSLAPRLGLAITSLRRRPEAASDMPWAVVKPLSAQKVLQRPLPGQAPDSGRRTARNRR